MAKRVISNLDLKIKLTKEYLENGGIEKIPSVRLLEDLILVKKGPDGKVNPDTVSTRVNAFMLALLGSHSIPPFYTPEHQSEYKSTLQKRNSFAQENIDTIEQFDKIYDEYKAKTNTLFRGQREAKWRLYNKLQRHWISDEYFNEESDFESFVSKLVAIGKNDYADNIVEILKTNHVDTLNPISVLSFLQHHNCPTPLLDWTYSFQNAVYFALDGLQPNSGTIEIEDYCSVYFIEEEYFQEGNLRNMIVDVIESMQEPEMNRLLDIFSFGDKERRVAMEKHFAGRKPLDIKRVNGSGLVSHMTKIENLMTFPMAYFSDRDKDTGIQFSLNNSHNILNQQGVFLWNAHPTKPVELIGDEMYKETKSEEEAKQYSFCSCFNIHKSLEGHIRKRLEADGITKEFIYPTPDINTWEVFEKTKKN